MISRFWEIEEVSHSPQIDPDEFQCEKHFQKTFSRNSTGRFILALPFKNSPTILGNNRSIVLKQLKNLEKKLQTRINENKLYDEFIFEYLSLNHITTVVEPTNYLIQHPCIMKESSSTTKLKVVFNASFKDYQGLTLNDTHYKGPKIQRDLD